MTAARVVVWLAAVAVLAICVYIFVKGSLRDGRWHEDLLAWYFLAKGIFCSISLVLSLRVVEILSRMAAQGNPSRWHDE